MRPLLISLVSIVILLSMVLPTAAWATHEVPDERPPTPLVDFREAVGSWIDPWLNETPYDIKDDHAPWLAFALYEELLGIKPESCYWDTYAAYWAVAAGLRALGQAPTREQQEGEFERVFDVVARAEALAELSAVACATWRSEVDVVEEETTPALAQDRGEETGSSRVIDIHATAALQFVDERENVLEEIGVTPGETVLFRVDNTAGFEHSFYIGSESELEEHLGVTDTGIAMWVEGIRESEWTVPDDVTGLLFGCTVPGHFTSMHGTFRESAPGEDTASD